MSGHAAIDGSRPVGVLRPGVSRPRRRGWWRWLRRVAIATLLGAVLVVAAALVFYVSLPSVSDAPRRVARILGDHGAHVVGVEPSSRVARAVVATEDERFFQHGAIDFVAVGRVAYDIVRGSPADPGGSTIAQQLAKVLYRPGSGVIGELRTVGLAIKLERAFSRREILGLYLNAIYFGHGFWGIQRASEGYFGRPPEALSWAQASTLAGLPQAPSADDPYRHAAAARARQHAVLAQLIANHLLSAREADAIERAPLALRRG